MSVSVDGLADAISRELQAYSQDVADDLKKSVKKAARVCVNELKTTSPEDTGDYRKGWQAKTAYESPSDIRVDVHNATDYQLTHLLEDGFSHITGGRVDGKPHIAPAADNAAALLEKDVKMKVGLR